MVQRRWKILPSGEAARDKDRGAERVNLKTSLRRRTWRKRGGKWSSAHWASQPTLYFTSTYNLKGTSLFRAVHRAGKKRKDWSVISEREAVGKAEISLWLISWQYWSRTRHSFVIYSGKTSFRIFCGMMPTLKTGLLLLMPPLVCHASAALLENSSLWTSLVSWDMFNTTCILSKSLHAITSKRPISCSSHKKE